MPQQSISPEALSTFTGLSDDEKVRALGSMSDGTKAQLLAAIKGQPPVGPSPDDRSAGQVAVDLAKDYATGIPQAITGIPATLRAAINAAKHPSEIPGLIQQALAPVGTVVRNANALNRASGIPSTGVTFDRPGTPEENSQAAQAAGATTGGMALAALPGVLNKIPRRSRAGAAFESIMGKAKDVPLDTTAADEAVARAMELKQRGSSMPKVLSDYAKNRAAATPEVGPTTPMTYETGRDFASNASAMSARDITRTNAKMQAQVSEFSKAMKSANREAASKVGMGDLYDQAMKEYRQASTLTDARKVIQKWTVRAALTAAGAKAGYDIYSKINP